MCIKPCKYRSDKKSQHYGEDYCTIVMECVSGCPVESMVRMAQDRLEGLLSVREYLQGLR